MNDKIKENKNKPLVPNMENVLHLEKRASELSARLLPIVGESRMEKFIAEETDDTMIEGIVLEPSGALDFSVPERRFSKLPPLWLKLAVKFLERLISELELMAGEESKAATLAVPVAFETKEMMARLGLGDLLTMGFVENIETSVKTKSGEVKPVNITASALRDKSGNIQGMVITAKDLSELQKLQREKLEIMEKSKEEAEKLVKERTAQLKQKIFELERFNKLSVGRELKMIELKKEIERFKSKKRGE